MGRANHIAFDTKQAVRRDYVMGKGSYASLSKAYNLGNQTIKQWSDSENWRALREMFGAEDEVFVCKKQLMQINNLMAKASDAETLHLLCRSKQVIAELFFCFAGVPRRPVGKLPKEDKRGKLMQLLESAHEKENVPQGTVDAQEPAQVIEVKAVEPEKPAN